MEQSEGKSNRKEFFNKPLHHHLITKLLSPKAPRVVKAGSSILQYFSSWCELKLWMAPPWLVSDFQASQSKMLNTTS